MRSTPASSAAPRLSLLSRLLVVVMEGTAGWSAARRLGLSVLAFVVVVTLEARGALLANFGFLNLLAAATALWCLGGRGGMVLCVMGAAAAALLRHERLAHLALPQAMTPGVELASFLSRVLSFALLACLIGGLRGILAAERWRADHDSLTGALNKGAFERAMAPRIAAAERDGCGALFAFIDLDGFKEVNDGHGHAVGDRVLVLFAQAAQHAIRDGDLFARLGGDEFALLLVLPPTVDGGHTAERLHRRLSALLSSTGYPVTCSMGALALAPELLGQGGRWLEETDALMYEAKRAGKNGLRIARGTALGPALRTAFPPEDPRSLDGEVAALLAALDGADRRTAWRGRHAA